MWSDWVLRLRSLLNRRAVEQELDAELRFHLDEQVASLMRQGLSRDEAVRRARLAFGGIDQIKEAHRDARGIRPVDELLRDLRHASRQLRRSPGFTLLAVLCLGFGIGVNTAIFTVVNAVLLRPMPVAEPDRLVVLSRGQTATFSYAAYRSLEAQSRVLSGLTASLPMESDIDIGGESEFVTAEVVPANYGDVLGVLPALGRWFEDDREPAAVISHAIWDRRFGQRPDVLGRQIRSESQSYTIVGVAPRELTGVFAPLRTDLWVPVRTRPSLAARFDEGGSPGLLRLFGRLRTGITPAQASAALNAIDGQLAEGDDARSEALSPITVESVRGIPNPGNRRRAATIATLLAAIVGVVLLIACVNVGHLLLARGVARQRELAVRRALGASRLRLFRQLLTECLLLALGGGLCGFILALWTTAWLEQSLPADGTFAVRLDLSLDWRTILFAALVSLVAVLLCGLLPAWRTSRARAPLTVTRAIAGGAPRVRPVGLVAQVVMSLVLLFVAASFGQGLLSMQSADPGSRPHLYRPFARQYAGGVTAVLVHTSTDPVAMAQPVRRALLGLDPDIRVYAVEPLERHVERSYAHVRWLAALVTAFGLLALLLAATGLSGVIAYRVTLRTQEIGLRMALGATRGALFRAVVGQGLAIVLAGVAIGQLLAVAVTRVMGSLHESLRGADLTTHLAVGLIWIAVAVVACYLPAVRAARVDPLVALRTE